jgi:hypothetical protein
MLEMPSLSVGEYVRAVVEGGFFTSEMGFWIDYEWKRLMRTFPMGCHVGIAVVDLDLGIGLEALYNSLGFACIIAMKMKTGRILLAGSVPICIDVSECDGFCSMIRLLWSHCEPRGISSMPDMGFLIRESTRLFSQGVLKIFVFSDKCLCNSFGNSSGDIVFWDMGSRNSSFGPFENITTNITYMSGYNSGLIRPFIEDDLLNGGSLGGDRNWLDGLLKRQYVSWNGVFDVFISRVNE